MTQACDVWLLTEIQERVTLAGFHGTRTESEMAASRRWAGIFARQKLDPLEDPHPATAAAVVADTTIWCSVLPWRGCGGKPPWSGQRHADWTRSTMQELLATKPSPPLIWGGDWNHALHGREYVGSSAGRNSILEASRVLGLQTPTAGLAHRLDELFSIDHIAVPVAWDVTGRERVVAELDGKRLSDHDAYLIDVTVA